MSMNLGELLARVRSTPLSSIEVEAYEQSTEIKMVTHDSGQVRGGALFCCVVGQVSDGHDYAAEAVAKGATALLCERPLGLGVPELRVESVRTAMGDIASAFHDFPSRSLQVVGVTGTNGKTSVAWWLQTILEAAGMPCGLIGTLGGARTTPEATELQALLAMWRDEGKKAVAMEVSSHALALSRVRGTSFAVAVFTNLGHDHLDFHGSEEEYFKAKAKLFDPAYTKSAVVNIDDPHGRLLFDAATVPTVGYSLRDVCELTIALTSSDGIWQGQPLHVPTGGAFNVSNALAAATAAFELGITPEVIVEALAGAAPIPGRFQSVGTSQGFSIIVDYAHTPDGLDQILQSVRSATTGRILVVFGCGGDRDQTKRPLMGRVAATRSDVVIVTSDNPRSENPDHIIEAVVEGAQFAPILEIEPDRRAAISRALNLANSGDVVVVAGKGHETTQTIGELVMPFDDVTVIKEELLQLEHDRSKANGKIE